MGSDEIFNLTAFAQRLKAERRNLPLAQMIFKARDIQSAHSDLKIAGDSLGILHGLLDTPSTEVILNSQIVLQALLNNAIILYARATETKSATRKTYDVRSKFSASQKGVHAEIIALRNDAVAHYGCGGSYQGEWQAEIIILQRRGDQAYPAAIGRRQIIDKNLCVRVATQVECARDLLREKFNNSISEVAIALGAPGVITEALQFPLNLPVFLQSREAAEAAIASYSPGGEAHGYVS